MNDRILLVNPPAEVVRECYDTPDYPHIGIAYVAGYLQRHGLNVAVLDAKLAKKTVKQTVDDIVEHRPRVLGLTAMTHMIATAAKVARAVQAVHPDTVVVLGGFHGSFLPERTLREFPAFDYIVVGEGEMAFLELVQTVLAGEDPSNVQGIASRVGSAVRTTNAILVGGHGVVRMADPTSGDQPEVRLNGRGRIPENLDDLGMPAWDLFPQAKMYPIMSQRGCPFGCNFCSRPYGRTLRQRTPKHVVAELMRSVEQYGCRRVDFYDETFTVRKDYVVALCNAIIAEGLHRKLRFWSYVHANTIDLPTAKKMKQAGFAEVGFGVESGDPEIMRRMKKGVNRNDVFRAARVFREARLKFGAYFIIGHPHETVQTARRSIDLAARINPDSVAFGIMTPYPGTEVWEMAVRGEGGYKMLTMDWERFDKQIGSALELENLSRRQMERLQLQGYLTVYLRNFRFREMLEAIGTNRKRIAFILKKLIRPDRRTASSSWLNETGREPLPAA
ncbi:MAG: radical SAM protein [Phycisphaerae bacterium]